MSVQAPVPGLSVQDPEASHEGARPHNDTAGDGIFEGRRRGIHTTSGSSIMRIEDSSSAEDTSEAKRQKHDNDVTAPSANHHLRDRVKCFTWTWFTMTMATGGIANILYSTPYKPQWLEIIGTIIFIFNLALFVMNAVCITLKFYWIPGSFKASFVTQTESLFVSACVVSTGTILMNICQYGIPHCGQWLQTTMQVCYWIYLCIAIISSSLMYLIIWSTQAFSINTMTPIWIFPAYPLLLLSPIASNLINVLPSVADAARVNSIAISLSSICVQGIGFLLSLMIYSAFVYRLMTQKLPIDSRRPGMFISVGPSGFTVAGIVHLGNIVGTKIMPDGFMGDPRASLILKILACMTGLWLWGLCIWFFIVSVGAHWHVFSNHGETLHFDMTWYSFVFPNTALVTATHAMAKMFDSKALRVLGTVMSALLILLWIFVFLMMLRSYWNKRLLWPDNIPRFSGREKSRERRNGGGGGGGGATEDV